MTRPATIFLLYHELALPGRELCQAVAGYVRYVLDAPEFEAHMLAIRQASLAGVSVSHAVEFPGRSIAITFDDGCETDWLVAAPTLKRLGFGATFYVTFAHVGQKGYLSVSQLRELSSAGFEIGSHSLTHSYLPDLEDGRLRSEIFDSKLRLEQTIGKTVEHFSCPGGRYDIRVVQLAREAGYRTVATSVPRTNSARSDCFLLGRVAMTRGFKPDTFERFCRGEIGWRFALNARLRDRAKRLLGNAAYDRVRDMILGQ
ncbi:MAG: polysaccharide deacetylase family protein [Acidobacteria bacterium]|nr:polysaccharide deacetylase family protein [Acidobacteriota bacterium]